MKPEHYNDENTIDDELSGLFIQTYLSKKKEEGGLGCDQICKIYDFGKFEDNTTKGVGVYAILEKLVGFDDFLKYILRNINTNGKIDGVFDSVENILKNITNIWMDALKGLNCMHNNLYAHLDIKIQNIALTNLIEKKNNDGKTVSYEIKNKDQLIGAKIIDFGLSKRFTPLKNSSLDFFKNEFDLDEYYHGSENIYLHKCLIKTDIYMFGHMLHTLFFSKRYLTNIDSTSKNEIRGLLNDSKILFPQKITNTYEISTDFTDSNYKETWTKIADNYKNAKEDLKQIDYELKNIQFKAESYPLLSKEYSIISNYNKITSINENKLINEINTKRASANNIIEYLHKRFNTSSGGRLLRNKHTKSGKGGGNKKSNKCHKKKRTNTRKKINR
jgi:serine/threonine protein kinase